LKDEALLQQAQLNKLETADKSDTDFLKTWMEHPDGGNFFLKGREAQIWSTARPDELVALSTLSSRHGECDGFTAWMHGRLVPWFHRHGAHQLKVSVT